MQRRPCATTTIISFSSNNHHISSNNQVQHYVAVFYFCTHTERIAPWRVSLRHLRQQDELMSLAGPNGLEAWSSGDIDSDEDTKMN
jgi:hypothetical protein